jgi:hypothetical protein
MRKKYEFSPTRVLTVTGTAHKWYMCDIFEKGSTDEICHVSHREKNEFEAIRDTMMIALEHRQSVKDQIQDGLKPRDENYNVISQNMNNRLDPLIQMGEKFYDKYGNEIEGRIVPENDCEGYSFNVQTTGLND